MNKSKPKFTVGELVLLEASTDTRFNGKCEVIFMEYVDGLALDQLGIQREYEGWAYLTTACGNPVVEAVLKKLPPDDRLSWEEMRESLNNVTEDI